jgi:glycogen synthase
VHIANLAGFLRAKGLEVAIFNTGSNKQIRADGVVNASSAGSLFARLLAGPKFGLIHVHVSHAQDYGKLLPVALAATATRVPWVTTIHSGNSAARLREASLPIRVTATALLGRAAAIITVNDAIADELSRRLGHAVVAVIPPFSVDFASSRLSSDVEDFLATHQPVISCVGLFDPTYGFDEAVRLMPPIREAFPNAGLMLIGDTRAADGCRALTTELGVEQHVKLCGNLSHAECMEAINQSALFLRPTRYDGDSLSVREALALGVPVVASATDFRPAGVVLYRSDVPGDLTEKVLTTLRGSTRSGARAANDDRNLEQVRQLYLQVMNR